MKICISNVRMAALPLALAAVFPSFSQTQTAPQLKEMVVTASRTAQRADELVSDVVIINRADIEKSTGRTLPEILARVPGIQFSANGGLGKNSSVNIRGAEARHTVLLIDGVRFGSATTGSPSWDTIPSVSKSSKVRRLPCMAAKLWAAWCRCSCARVFRVSTRMLH
jgi:vitamin B12 transporter